MEIAVRGFLFDEEDNILLVKHAADQMWVLPGGHLEPQDE
ncbi:MAG: NUDIX domain-containing protein [Candidatus Peribacteria bacterium]|nr:MAG: NUDIX domain-containing protein [Candidatus Peribacteria bacterium]